MSTVNSGPVDKVIAALGERGCKPATSGPGEWHARCPAHRGDDPDLSIKEADDGTVILHCHRKAGGKKGCSPGAITSRWA